MNYAEVVSRLADLGVPPDEGALAVTIEVVALDRDQAEITARLRPVTRAQGLSLGGRACLALAKARGLPAFTADRAWAQVDAGVEIVLIR